MPTRIPNLNYCVKKIEKCTVKRAQHLAVAFTSSGHILCYSVNKGYECIVDRKNYQNYERFSVHAEQSLIDKLQRMKIRERFQKVHLLSIRFCKIKGFCISKPCSACQEEIDKFNFSEVYYCDRKGRVVQQ